MAGPDDDNSRDCADAHPMVGQVLGERYRIDALLGEGGMGAVFRATHLSLERPVAVKILHPRLTDDEHVSKRFDREALAVSKLDHPGCVQVVDFGTTTKGMKYLVMQFLDGRELRDMTGVALPVAEVVDIGAQIFRALEHAHKRGLVHRDLKPENIFLVTNDDGDTVVKLVDFGIVKLIEASGLEQLTRKGMAFGTPTYMSPEQAAGGTVDPRTDLYAVGILLYELLTGEPPFDGDEPGILLRMHILADPPPLPDTIPQALSDVVLKLLEKEADDRYQTAREARLALEAAATEPEPVEASIPPMVASVPDAATDPAVAGTMAERAVEAATEPEDPEQTAAEPVVAADAQPGVGEAAVPVRSGGTIKKDQAENGTAEPESFVPVRSGGTVVAGSSSHGAPAVPVMPAAHQVGAHAHGAAAAGASASHGGAAGASTSYGGVPAGASASYGGAPAGVSTGHGSVSGGYGVAAHGSSARLPVDPRAASSAHHPVGPALHSSGSYPMSGAYPTPNSPGMAPRPRKRKSNMVLVVVVLLLVTWAAIGLLWYSMSRKDRTITPSPTPVDGVYRFTDEDDGANASGGDSDPGASAEVEDPSEREADGKKKGGKKKGNKKKGGKKKGGGR